MMGVTVKLESACAIKLQCGTDVTTQLNIKYK
jgi:hypothetical protein